MSTPTQLRSFWNEFETKAEKLESSGSSPTRSPIRSSRSSLQSNAFVQMDLNSSNRLNSPYSSPMGPQRHQRKPSQRESVGNSTSDSLVPPFNKENHESPTNTGEVSSKTPKSIPTSDYDRFPLFMNTASGTVPVAPEPFAAVSEESQRATKNSRESDNFTKYLGSRNSRLSDATIIHHPIDWSTTSHTQSGSQNYEDYNDNYYQNDLYNHNAYCNDNGHLPLTNEEDTSQIATPVPENYDYTTPTINNSSEFTNSVHTPIAKPDMRTPIAKESLTFPQAPAQSPRDYSHIKIKPEPTEEVPWTPHANISYTTTTVSTTSNGIYAKEDCPPTPKIKTEPVDDSYSSYVNVKIKKEPVDEIFHTPRQGSNQYHYQNGPVIKTEPGLETPIFRVLGSGNNTPAFPHHSQFDYDSPEKEPVYGTRLIDKLQPSISEEPDEHYKTPERAEAIVSLKLQNEKTEQFQKFDAEPDKEQPQNIITGNTLQAQFQEPCISVPRPQHEILNNPRENKQPNKLHPTLASEAPIIDSKVHEDKEKNQEHEEAEEGDDDNEEEDDDEEEDDEDDDDNDDECDEEEEGKEQFENVLPPTIFAPGTKLRARPSMNFKDFMLKNKEEQDEEKGKTHDEIQSPFEEKNDTSGHLVDVPKLELDLFDLTLGGDSILDDMTKEFDKALNTEKV